MSVFDGIRRYDLAALDGAAGALPARASGTIGPVHGEAMACRLSVGYLSGFPASAPGSSFYPDEITVWLAPLDGQEQVVPVLAIAEVAVGQLRLELVSASASGAN
jgi:hypothetical protein